MLHSGRLSLYDVVISRTCACQQLHEVYLRKLWPAVLALGCGFRIWCYSLKIHIPLRHLNMTNPLPNPLPFNFMHSDGLLLADVR